jgi:hypothetical protein
MADETETIADNTDRRVVVLNDLSDPHDIGTNAFIVASPKLEGQLSLVAKSSPPAFMSWPLIQQANEWYARKIARRSASDQHYKFAKGASFALYRLPAGPVDISAAPPPNQ